MRRLLAWRRRNLGPATGAAVGTEVCGQVDDVSAPVRFFFVHLQKTAGSSLVFRLRHQFGSAVYPSECEVGAPTPAISVEYLETRLRLGHDSIRLIAGHFPLCTTDVLGGRFTTLSLLREPVARTLSYLRHHVKVIPGDRDRPLEEIYDDPFRFHGFIHNHAVKMLSLTPAEMTAGMLTPVDFTRAHLERARANLSTMDVIGVTERFEQFCAGLTARFGWDLGEPVHRNRTEPVAIGRTFRRRIAEDNALDLELYDFARSLVTERSTRTRRTRDSYLGVAEGS